MRYKKNVAICDALPTLEETFYISAQKILNRLVAADGMFALRAERCSCELNWSKILKIFEITVVGMKERLESKEEDPELLLDSNNPHVYW